MNEKKQTKLVREGDYVADVGVGLISDASAWTPYLSVADATKLDEVRHALRDGDLARASQLADRIYKLSPLSLGDRR